MMHSPTSALVWEIWRRHRVLFVAVIALTATGRTLEAQSATADFSVVVDLLRMLSFLILFGIFSYTESSDSRGLGRFPQRLFVLPVSSLRLAAVPVLAGLVSVELLYLLWLDPRSTGGFTSIAFSAALLGTLMLCSQTAIWTLDRLGPFRLVVIGILVVVAFWISLLPFAPPSPPPVWRSEGGLAALVSGGAVLVFVGAWRHIVRVRSGAWHGALTIESLGPALAALLPRRRRAFRSPAAAHFWFEWRCSGLVLPLLTGGVLLAVIAPLSWLGRHDANDTRNLLIGALATPVLLAIPVGMGFAKPTFWSEDLSIPAFIAVRPLTDEDLVATKVKVAMASAATSWLAMLAFVGVWLALWGNLDSLGRIAAQLWALYGYSVAAIYGLTALIVLAGVFLTWRFLVSRLWTGLSGCRTLFIGSAVTLVFVAGASLVFDVTRLPGWVLGTPAHMTGAVSVAGIAVAAKYGFAAYSWRRVVAASYARQYLLLWLLGTTSFAMVGILLVRIAREMTLDVPQLQVLVVLVALLAIPVGRLGLARIFLTRNRHR